MKKVYLLAMLAAVLFGALMFLYLNGQQSATASTGETKTVVVLAAVDIAPNTEITKDMLQEQEVPVDAVQVNAVTKLDDAVGKCCASQIVKGQQLQTNLLEQLGSTGVHLSTQITEDMRAMTIKAEVDAGVGGYLKAGDRIDLLGSMLDAEGNVIGAYKIVENIQVIRVSVASGEGETPYSYLTLSMNEAQCTAVYVYQANTPSGSTSDWHALLRSSGGAQ